MNPSFPHHLRYLNLGHMAEHYEAMAAQAAEKSWSPLEYLQRLVEGEYDLRQQRALERRVRAARFPVVKTLDRFDWSWPTKIDELKIRSIFRLGFIAKNVNAREEMTLLCSFRIDPPPHEQKRAGYWDLVRRPPFGLSGRATAPGKRPVRRFSFMR
jgi:hypothetical protein